MQYWLFLLGAIVFEVLGTLTMKYTVVDAPIVGIIIMYIMLGLSYYAFAIAIKRIHLAVAYGAWESLGLVLISVCCFLFFEEPINFLKIAGIAAIITGIVLLKVGSFEGKDNDNNREEQDFCNKGGAK